jgi:hypothetical protein
LVTRIGDYAFDGCEFTEIYLPSILFIGTNAFGNLLCQPSTFTPLSTTTCTTIPRPCIPTDTKEWQYPSQRNSSDHTKHRQTVVRTQQQEIRPCFLIKKYVFNSTYPIFYNKYN